MNRQEIFPVSEGLAGFVFKGERTQQCVPENIA
jgi:hypothetical protein